MSTKVIKRSKAKIERKRELELVVTPESFVRNEDGTAVVDVTLATEAPVLRTDGIFVEGKYHPEYYEILLMSGLNAARIKGKRGIPFLNSHQTHDLDKVLGRSVPDSLRIEGKEAHLKFKLGKRCATLGYTDDIENGTIGDTSVGYCINAYELTVPEEGIPTLEATDWTPHENSGVPVPADPNAVIRSRNGKRKTKVAGKRADDTTVPKDETAEDERELDDVEGEEADDDAERSEADDESERAEGDADDEAERAEGDESDEDDELADDEDDSDEDKEDKARARKLRSAIRAKKEAKRSGFTVLDPAKNSQLRQIMADARELGVVKKVDAIRRNGGSMEMIRQAMLRSYVDVGTTQARSRINSRPDASARRSAEDGPEDVVQRAAPPTDAQINAEIRSRKAALRR